MPESHAATASAPRHRWRVWPVLVLFFASLAVALAWLFLVETGAYQQDTLARFSPDGGSVVMLRRVMPEAEGVDPDLGFMRGSLELWTMQADGRQRRRLWVSKSTSLVPERPVLSFDGKSLTVWCLETAAGPSKGELIVVDLQQGQVLADVPMPRDAEPVGSDGYRFWLKAGVSQPGTELQAERLEVMGANSLPQPFMDLASNHIQSVYRISPSPTGRLLAMTLARSIGEATEDALAFVNADGTGLRIVPALSGKLSKNMAWSRDGKVLLVQRDTEIMDVDIQTDNARLIGRLPWGLDPGRLVGFGQNGDVLLASGFQLISLNPTNGGLRKVADCSPVGLARPRPAQVEFTLDQDRALLSDAALGSVEEPEGAPVVLVDLTSGRVRELTRHSRRWEWEHSAIGSTYHWLNTQAARLFH